MLNFKHRLYRYIGKKSKFNINVMDNITTLKYVLKNNTSVVRFGDGELDLINGKSIAYQSFDNELSLGLANILYTPSNKNLLVCLPDVFSDIDRYDNATQNWYFENFFIQNKKIFSRLEKSEFFFGSTFISRPYLALKNKEDAKSTFEYLKKLWKNKEILIVEGEYSRSGEGNDLFSSAKSIQRIICPSQDAYSKLNKISEEILKFRGNKLILIMLGPTAKVLISRLSKLGIENQMIDLGHVDSEYEWYIRKSNVRIKIPGKHTAEFNNDDNTVILKKDQEFENQIVSKVN